MFIHIQSQPELLDLPFQGFSFPQKSGACDTQPAKPIWDKKLHNVPKLKWNFPLNLPPHSRFWLVMMTDQHRPALVCFSACIYQQHKLRQKTCPPPLLFTSLFNSLPWRSRGMHFPLSISHFVHASILQPRNVFVMQNCLCHSHGNNVWLVDKSLPRLLRVSSLHKSSISILPYHWMIYVTKQHSMNCNFYNQIYNLHYIFGRIF